MRYTASLMVLLGFLCGPALGRAQQTPGGILDSIGIDQKLDEAVPLDVTLRDETGRQVQLREYFGEKPVILSFVYFKCPMLCTLVLNGLVRSLRATDFDAGKEFNVITVSFDPSDTWQTAATMKRVYMDEYRRPNADRGWHFLTGDQESIHRLTDSVGFRYQYDPVSGEWAHATGIVVLTPKGRVAQYFYGLEYSARDLRLSLVESAANRIGSPVDRLLLYCFRYDPSKGKYGVVIMNVLRLGGVGTVLGLGALIFTLVYRQRK